MSRLISIIFIVIGAAIAIYAEAGAQQNQYVLIGGIVVLMIGVYRISRNISSKNDREDRNINDDNL